MLRRPAPFVVLALVTAAAGTALGSGSPASAATDDDRFEIATIAAFDALTTVEWLPSGELVVLEQDGRAVFVRPDGSTADEFEFDVCAGGERGLLGFAADPAYLTNETVYVYYTRRAPDAPGGCVNRLSRVEMATGAETVLLDNISSVNGNHNGGALEIGGDGYLYVGVGDAGRDPRGRDGRNQAAQDLSLLNGKILRITRDGRPAPGNPLLDEPGVTRCATRGNTPATPTTPCAEIWAWGLRNPYRIAFDHDAGTERLFANDVGQGTYEEVDRIVPGNFGWPDREGPCPQGDTPPCSPTPDDMIDPVAWYGRELGSVITGGAFVPDGVWPAEFDGAYLFADAGSGRMWLMRADGSVDYQNPFATGLGGLSDMTFGYDTDGRATLYFVTTGGRLGAITPTDDPAVTPDTRTVFTPAPPFRAFDSADGPAGTGDHVAAASTRLIDTGVPEGATAALVNITIADTAGPGYLRTWRPRALRPATSAVNAESGAGFVANAAIVPVDDEGRFVVEASTAARVVVDVMGSFHPAAGGTSAGRFVSLPPARAADTREPAGTDNAYTDTGSTTIVDLTGLGFPDGDVTGAYVLSIAAIAAPGTPGGFAGAFPGGGEYTGTSNVNVVSDDVRANMVVVPADGTGKVAIEHLNTTGLVVDVLGYFTGSAAEESSSGQFGFVVPTRLVDTREGEPFDSLAPGEVASIQLGDSLGASALVQNVTVVPGMTAGYVSTFPGDTPVAGVSSVNWVALGVPPARAALAFTGLDDDNRIGYQAPVAGTDLVVDAVGTFSR